MSNQTKTLEELQEFCNAQQKVIIQLNKKIQKLEAEKNHAESLLKNAPVQIFSGKEVAVVNDMATEEAICAMQVKRLEEISLARELTLEETRKLEAFSKILATFRNGTKTIDVKSKHLDDKEVLRLIENDNDGK